MAISKRRGVSWGSDSESDISDYEEYSYSKTRSTKNGRDTFPRNKRSHMVEREPRSRYTSDEERRLDNRANGRWTQMMDGRYVWFGAFILFEAVNVIVPWVVYYLILNPSNTQKAAAHANRGNVGRALWRIGKELNTRFREPEDLWYYPLLAVIMTLGALYICLLLAIMRSTRNVPIAIGVKVLQVLMCLSVFIWEMWDSSDMWDMAADMLGWDGGRQYGMPAYMCLAFLNMIIGFMLYFAFFFQTEKDKDDRIAAQQERRALLAEKGRYSAVSDSDGEDAEHEVVEKKVVKKKTAKKTEAYPDVQSPTKVENYYYTAQPAPVNMYTVAAPQPQVTTYQIEVQPQPVEYTTTTTTIDVNTLPSRYENGQTIYTVDLH